MLVITRKTGESFSLSVDGNDITVMIVSVRGLQVKIGIIAENNVKILRDNAKKITG